MKTGFIGCGKMAEAIISSLISAKVLKHGDIIASDVDRTRLNTMKKKFGIVIARDNHQVAEESRILFVAVKPQQMKEALVDIAPHVSAGHLVISIAAGIKLPLIEAVLKKARVVRVMPNIPCAIAEGMSVFALGSGTRKPDRRLVKRMLGAMGEVMEMAEARFDAVTALSGSGPAFFAYCLNSFVEGAAQEGLDRVNALAIAEQTMLGTAAFLKETGIAPGAMIAQVASARGTTAEGLAILDNAQVKRQLGKAIRAAARRSRELSQGI